jgi:cystathionine beta-lyase
MTRKERLRIGITDQLIRFAVGVEDAKDILSDIEQALALVKAY